MGLARAVLLYTYSLLQGEDRLRPKRTFSCTQESARPISPSAPRTASAARR